MRDEPLRKSAWEVSKSHAPVNLHFVIQEASIKRTPDRIDNYDLEIRTGNKR